MDDTRARRDLHRVEQRRARQLSHRHHVSNLSQDRSRDRQSHWSMSFSTKPDRKAPAFGRCNRPLQQSVVISTINAAVEARVISSRKDERVAASKILPQPKPKKFTGDRKQADRSHPQRALRVENRFLCPGDGAARRCQQQYNWNLNFGDIATIWRGGCIIRAKFLNRIVEAYKRDPGLHNLAARFLLHRTSSKKRRTTGASPFRPRSNMALPFRRFPRRWRTSTVIAPLGCLRICCRRSAISSARTLTSASTSRASFTPNGSSRITNQSKSRLNRKSRERHAASNETLNDKALKR